MSSTSTHEDIEQERSLLAAIVTSSDDAIASKTLDGVITTWNLAAERMFGHSAAEAVGQPMTIVFPPDRLDEERTLLDRIANGETIRHYETVRVRKDGSSLDVSATLSPIRDVRGRIVGVSNIARDITERKRQAERASLAKDELLRAVAEFSPDPIFVKDRGSRLLFANAATSVAMGRRADEKVVGRTDAEVYDDQEMARVIMDNDRRIMESGQTEVIEEVAGSPTGPRTYLSTKTPWCDADGNVIGIVGVARDITDRKRAESEVRLAKAEAERAVLSRSKFLAAASHDLRQPVQSLILLLDVLKAHANTALVAKAIGAMEAALDGLNALLTSILDISRIDAGVVAAQIRSVDVGGMIERLCAEYAPLCAAKGLRLRDRGKPGLHGRTDAALLERIIRNLVENAIRYTDHGGLLIAARRRGDRLRIDIIDSGIGIPADKLGHIFEEFYQVANPARDAKQGLGLGLSIVSRLAVLIGADLQVRSNDGRGTRFTLSLALDTASHEVSAPTAKADVVMGRRIMVIEDNPKVRMGLQLLLESWNCEVFAAETGEDALEAGDREGWRLDAIISDYRLGAGMSGTEAATEIQRRSGQPIPTLIITGDTAPERIEEVHASGFKMLHKPVTPDVLAREMAHLLRGGGGRRGGVNGKQPAIKGGCSAAPIQGASAATQTCSGCLR